ncbi:MAG: DUF2102 domain-containing protein [Candidatus Bathyarchaeia archaeon]
MTETYAVKVFISPLSPLTPSVLRHRVESLGMSVTAAEKSYGIVLRGQRRDVDACVMELRKLDQAGIFVRKTGPPFRNNSVFRGFLQTAAEYSLLPQFSNALAAELNQEKNKPTNRYAAREKTGEAVIYAVDQGLVKFWVCREGLSGELISASGGRHTTMQEAQRKGYHKIREGPRRTSPAAPTSVPAICGTMVMCRCWPETLVEAAVTLHADDNISVRCPLGEVCGVRCPYGRLEPWAFSPYCSGAYLKTRSTAYVPSR